ncbi:MAG TPA: carboxyl transferase domain-containing protein [Acidimicrobiales bacterium]
MLQPLLEEWDLDLRSGDPLTFPGYAAELAALPGDSVRTGRTEHYVLIEGDFSVIGGSMGVVHGEKVVRAFDRAIELGLPVVAVNRSGGARMQEGMVALIQLPRTAAAARRHAKAGLLSVAVFRSPTTGGVLASYGSLCDVSVAEEGAVIGFAGPRVAEFITEAPLGDSSHRAESAFAAGLVDAVRPLDELAAWVDAVLGVPGSPSTVPVGAGRTATTIAEVAAVPGSGGAWHEVQLSRRPGRPTGVDLLPALVSSWVPLGGGAADPTLQVGLATVAGARCVVLASDRYAGTGRPGPAAYRLAQRGITLAGRLGWPVVSLVDLPSAEPGAAAENDGIAREIARTFTALADLRTPSVAVCVGEGGSGGALALAHADVLLIQEHAIFSVIGPEAAAVILQRDASGAPQVAEDLGLTSADVVALGIADAVIPDDIDATVAAITAALADAKPGQRDLRLDAASRRWLRSAD